MDDNIRNFRHHRKQNVTTSVNPHGEPRIVGRIHIEADGEITLSETVSAAPEDVERMRLALAGLRFRSLNDRILAASLAAVRERR